MKIPQKYIDNTYKWFLYLVDNVVKVNNSFINSTIINSLSKYSNSRKF